MCSQVTTKDITTVSFGAVPWCQCSLESGAVSSVFMVTVLPDHHDLELEFYRVKGNRLATGEYSARDCCV